MKIKRDTFRVRTVVNESGQARFINLLSSFNVFDGLRKPSGRRTHRCIFAGLIFGCTASGAKFALQAHSVSSRMEHDGYLELASFAAERA